jgi:glycosyltransferase involved in cell wall biosynthesis
LKICIAYQGSSLAGCERIEKMARTLRRGGHDAVLICNDYGDVPRGSDRLGDMPVCRIGPTFGSISLNRIVKFPLFCNPLWVAQLGTAVNRVHADAIQVVDIPLAPTALFIGRMFRLPVVLDMWENYPEALRIWEQTNWVTRVFKNHAVARAVERWVVPRVDHIFTVIEEQKERLVKEGARAERVSVVTNAVDPELFHSNGADPATAPDGAAREYRLLYVGAITRERGLDDIIRALPLALPSVPRLVLNIAGGGDDEARLRRLACDLGVAESVHFLGWVPFREIPSHIANSDLCLVPHIYSAFINTTIPNKLFQYMAMAKPVLVSHAKPLARIVGESGCGLVFQSGDPADAARRIVEMFRSPDTAGMGARGRCYAQEHYTWEQAAAVLLNVYAGLEERCGKARRRGDVAGA